MKKGGFIVLCVGLVVILLVVQTLTEVLNTGLCENKIQREVTAPWGKNKAVVFTRVCSDTTVNVSVLNAGDTLPNKPGNVFVHTGSRPDVSWQDEHTLLIHASQRSEPQVKHDSAWLMRLPLPEQVTVKFE
jgi:hypothetical protein